MTTRKKPTSAPLSPSLEQLFTSQLAPSSKAAELFAVPISVQKVMLQLASKAMNVKVLAALAAYDKTDVSILETLALQVETPIRSAFISRTFTPSTSHLLPQVLKQEKRATVFLEGLKRTIGRDTFPQIFIAALKCFEEKPTIALAEFFSSSSAFKDVASLSAKLSLYKSMAGKSFVPSYKAYCVDIAKELAVSKYASEAVLATKYEDFLSFFYDSVLTTKAVDYIYEHSLKSKLVYLNSSKISRSYFQHIIQASTSFKKNGYLPAELLAGLTQLVNSGALSAMDTASVLNILDPANHANPDANLSMVSGKAFIDGLKMFFSLFDPAVSFSDAKSLLANPNISVEQRTQVLNFLVDNLKQSWRYARGKGIDVSKLSMLDDADKDVLYMGCYDTLLPGFAYRAYEDGEAAKLRLLKKAAAAFQNRDANSQALYVCVRRLEVMLACGVVSDEMLEALPAKFYLTADYYQRMPYAPYMSILQDKYLGSDAKKWELFISFLNTFDGTLGDLFSMIDTLL